MKMLKVRRLGDSNIVVLPKELEALGYVPGRNVLVRGEPNGEVRIIPAEHLDELIGGAIRDVATESREALRILADHDRDTAASLDE